MLYEYMSDRNNKETQYTDTQLEYKGAEINKWSKRDGESGHIMKCFGKGKRKDTNTIQHTQTILVRNRDIGQWQRNRERKKNYTNCNEWLQQPLK